MAASMCGITPVMAAEVEPYPIAVTKSRFPKMKHLGNVQNVRGGEIEPVDIITFGSPCQDLSVAGKRKGLKHAENGDDETTRSGLFMEAVRIIKEMREATNGVYPRYAVWENVPGAFSSNKGEDFRTVLDELIKISEPDAVMPDVPKAGWAYADCYSGDGWSLAYRVFDAQYWGVPQRRRRIYLVADFRGGRAGEILFEREGVRGYFAQGRTPWQTAAGNVESGIGTDDCIPINTMLANRHITLGRGTGFGIGEMGDKQFTISAGHSHAVCIRVKTEQAAGFDGNMGAKAGNIGYKEETAPTLNAGKVMDVVFSFDSISSNSMKSKNPYSGCRQVEGCKTLDASGPDPSKNQGGIAVVQIKEQHLFENHSQDTRFKGPLKVCPNGNDTPFVVEDTPVYCLQGNGIDRALTAGCNGKGWKEGQCYTLNTIDRPAIAYAVGNGQANQVYLQDKTGALNCMHDQQAIVLDRAFFNQGQNAQYKPQFYADGTCPTLVAKGPHAVQVRYIVRRLTPTECARLQGFPDKWGHPDKKETLTDDEYRFWLEVRNTHAAINGKAEKEYTKEQMLKWYNKLYSDSAEYKMWGNGIALPNALYVMQGIVGE